MHIEQGNFLSVSQKNDIILFGCLLQLINLDNSLDEFLSKLDCIILLLDKLFWINDDVLKLFFLLFIFWFCW